MSSASFQRECFQVLPIQYDIGCGFVISLIILRYVPLITSLLRVFSIKGCWILSEAFSASIEIIMWVFVFGSVYVMNYVYRFVYVETALHPRDDANLIMMDKFSMCCWIPFSSIFLRIFVLMSIMDIGLKFSFLVVSLSGFGIRMVLVS